MTAPRTYVIGLPVWITVTDEGTVTFDIDTAEASDAPAEYDSEACEVRDEHAMPFVPDADVLLADAEWIEAAAIGRRSTSVPLDGD